MAKSIMQKEKECYLCGTTYNLHKHHVFGGANRPISEKNGFTIFLCAAHHNMSDVGIHFNREFDLEVKRTCQTKFEKTHSREEFMKLIGKNYLD
jgi:hypothetical protein